MRGLKSNYGFDDVALNMKNVQRGLSYRSICTIAKQPILWVLSCVSVYSDFHMLSALNGKL